MFFSQSRKDRRGNNKNSALLCVSGDPKRRNKKTALLCVSARDSKRRNKKHCVTLRLCARPQKKKQKTLRYSASLREIFIIFVEYFSIDYDSQNI